MPRTSTPDAPEDADVRPAADSEPGPDLIRSVADAKKPEDVSPEDAVSATDWFLSDDPDDDKPAIDVLEINLGSPANPRWVSWTIQAVDEAELNRINRMVANRQQRRGRSAANDGGEQQAITNCRIVAAGTLDPPIADLAKQKGVADPATAVRQKFRRKPGLILQIAGSILTLSGYDDDDVREAREVKAAGN